MITAEEITEMVIQGIGDASVHLEDLTGGQDHWSATIISDAFAGVSRVRQHQMVYATLAEPLKGPLHALQLRTLTQEQAREAGLLEN
jgi:stress-induced morphogen